MPGAYGCSLAGGAPHDRPVEALLPAMQGGHPVFFSWLRAAATPTLRAVLISCATATPTLRLNQISAVFWPHQAGSGHSWPALVWRVIGLPTIGLRGSDPRRRPTRELSIACTTPGSIKPVVQFTSYQQYRRRRNLNCATGVFLCHRLGCNRK